MQRRNELQEIFLGILLLIGLHIIAIPTFIGLAYILGSRTLGMFFSLAVIGIGLSQLYYVIPLVIWLYQRRKWGLIKGVIIGAVLTALLNGGGLFWVVSTCSYG